MNSRMKARRWSLADRISVAVVLGALAIAGFGWQSGAIGRVHQGSSEQMTTALAAAAGGCGDACGPSLSGISGDPATGMPYPR
jgi:hypothetical protein